VIWGLATNKKGSEFISHQARDGLRRAGFDCADLGNLAIPELAPEQLKKGSVRQTIQVRREQNRMARARCNGHYSSKWDERQIFIVCDFDFPKFYAELGEEFTSVHHPTPSPKQTLHGWYRLIPTLFQFAQLAIPLSIGGGGVTRPTAEIRQALSEN
jgi:hypothetical protein